MRIKQQGFTLVELIVVIVILGILAATAIPRYADYTRNSRIAALNGLAGSIRSAVTIVQGAYLATLVNPVVMADGTNPVAVSIAQATAGLPLSTAGGIDNAVATAGTFVYTAGAATGTYDFPTAIASCNVTYTAATGAATVNTGVPGAGC